jgi:hypothetical protein
MRAIAATLNGDGVPTKKGCRWDAKGVSNVLVFNMQVAA